MFNKYEFVGAVTAALVGAFVLGVLITASPSTMQLGACKHALTIDNQMFGAAGTLDATIITSLTPERTQLYKECMQ